ncbi:MAG: phosphate/phosphite/phosphonate ABC transporter substrate-binding protein, partial [Nitrospirae bacterium]
MITPVEAVKYYQDIVDYVGKKLGMPVEMVHRRTYDEMDKLLEKGQVHGAFICSAPYVKNQRTFGVELLVVPQVRGSVFYHSYIIVHKDSPIRTFEELKGRTFAFTDPKSNSGRLYPVYLLAKMGYRPEEFFSRYIYSYSHNKSVELVAKKKVDAAAVESLVYEYMKLKGSPYVLQTKVIEKSPPFGIPPFVVSPQTSLFVKEKLKEILLNMHKDPEGRAILKEMLIERFVEAPDSNYDTIRRMEAFVEAFYGKDDRERDKKKERVVRFGVIPRDNPRIAFEKYQPLVDYLSEATGLKIELTMKRTYEETIVALGNGEMDLALLGPLSYLEARARYGVLPILKSVTSEGKPYY